ncbi:hypothetical protein K438DRAFT_2015378 [Mycena galopus ATCC 62051]|nr:hypothetical protein K438DRAFT_2015378 [Mycena galopus ATCC 62051]
MLIPSSLLPFLPLGLSPASSGALMPMLPWLFGLLALLGYVARHTIGSVFLSLKSLRRPIRSSVLPTTNGEARSTAPAPTATLRGRGRGRSQLGFGRRFGLGSGLSFGRRAKSLGPVLPRFHPPDAHHGSAPASPGLRVPGNEDAVPLGDLAASDRLMGSWASLSSFSDGASVSGSAQELVDVSHEDAHAHSESLVDLSHPHPYVHPHPHSHAHSLVDLSHPPDDGFELVDVSVPPSPAAWALAHPALQPTPAATAPTSPAVASFFPSIQTSNENDDDNDTMTATTPVPAATPAPVLVDPVLVDLEKPSDDTGDIEIARRPQTPPPQQLPSPPISPPPTARFAPGVFRAMQGDAPLALPLPAFGAEQEQEQDAVPGIQVDPFADPVLVEVNDVEEEDDADADAEIPLTARPRRHPFGDPVIWVSVDCAEGGGCDLSLD